MAAQYRSLQRDVARADEARDKAEAARTKEQERALAAEREVRSLQMAKTQLEAALKPAEEQSRELQARLKALDRDSWAKQSEAKQEKATLEKQIAAMEKRNSDLKLSVEVAERRSKEATQAKDGTVANLQAQENWARAREGFADAQRRKSDADRAAAMAAKAAAEDDAANAIRALQKKTEKELWDAKGRATKAEKTIEEMRKELDAALKAKKCGQEREERLIQTVEDLEAKLEALESGKSGRSK